MSQPRWPWWSYVKEIIRRYPALAAQLRDIQSPGITVQYGGTGGGSGISRQTERLALAELPGSTQREYQAVADALAALESRPGGRERLKLIRMVYWRRTHTLAGAAYKLHISEITARRWNREIILLVAEKMGLFEAKKAKDDTLEPK